MSDLQKVLDSNMCAGCGLCANEPREMQINKDGYARPTRPIFDSLSQNGCPSINLQQTNSKDYDLSWGPVLSSLTGHASDDAIRTKGSSGGVLTAILYMCLDRSYVDGVIQVGKSTNNPVANQTNIVTEKELLINNAGSRYAPSSPLSVIRGLIGDGKRYALVAKPCDIAALRKLTANDEKIKKQFPVLLSFMCAGIPSEHSGREILSSFELKPEEVIDFRYRGDGWPGLTIATTKSGLCKSMTYNQSWGTILNKKLQTRCKFCVDGTGEFSDITCADAWEETSNGYPSFEEKAGRSLILTRNKAGEDLLDKAVKFGYLDGIEHFDIQRLKLIQPYQYNRKRMLLARLFGLKMTGHYTPMYKNFSLFRLSIKTSPIRLVRAFLGSFLRSIRNKI